MTLSKKPVAKKRGRPPGSKNKTSAAKVRAWETKTSLRREISRLLRCRLGSS
jgi:predicted component of type VI protein secretion system